MAVTLLGAQVTGSAGTMGVAPQKPPGGALGKAWGPRRRPQPPTKGAPPRAPAVGKPVLLPVGWAPARPCRYTQSGADVSDA